MLTEHAAGIVHQDVDRLSGALLDGLDPSCPCGAIDEIQSLRDDAMPAGRLFEIFLFNIGGEHLSPVLRKAPSNATAEAYSSTRYRNYLAFEIHRSHRVLAPILLSDLLEDGISPA